MDEIKLQSENPNGLHKRFVVRRITGWRKQETMFGVELTAITKAVDPKAEYFVLRLDDFGRDPVHIAACRKAVLCYAKAIELHLPQLAQDLMDRYGPQSYKSKAKEQEEYYRKHGRAT